MSARRTRPDFAICRRSSHCAASCPPCCAETSTPVLVKIAPDLADTDIDEIADLAVELGLAGIVATNTTVSRDGLSTPGVEQLGSGGISGPPLARRAAEVLRRLYGRVGDRLTLISVGGIETVDDAWDRITAGASLLQGYTGFIYGGGLWAKHIHDGLAIRLREGGFASLTEAVGSATRQPPVRLAVLPLFVGPVDHGSRDRVLKEVEAQNAGLASSLRSSLSTSTACTAT